MTCICGVQFCYNCGTKWGESGCTRPGCREPTNEVPRIFLEEDDDELEGERRKSATLVLEPVLTCDLVFMM